MGLHPRRGRGPWISVRTWGGRTVHVRHLKSWRSSLWRQCRPHVAAPTRMPICRGVYACSSARSCSNLCSISFWYCQAVFCILYANRHLYVLIGSATFERCIGVCTLYFILLLVPDYIGPIKVMIFLLHICFKLYR